MLGPDHATFYSCVVVALLTIQITPANSQSIAISNPSTISEYPFMVQLKHPGALTVCSGVLVSPQHVLTAAHCVEDRSMWKHMSVFGGLSHSSKIGVERKISKVVIHPERNATRSPVSLDVAVLKLTKPFEAGQAVQAVTQLCTGPVKCGDVIKVAAWPEIRFDGAPLSENSEELHVSTLPTISNDKCSERFSNLMTTQANLLDNNHMCGYAKDYSSCSFNAGGAVFNKDELCGIVSWTIGCEIDEYPIVFTNIYDVKSFIKASMAA